MRKVILAAALAATFCLSQTSHAQQGGGGAGSGAPAGGAGGQGASGGGQTFQGTGDQAPGAATGLGQTFYGPREQGAADGTGGTGSVGGTGAGAATDTGAGGTGAVGADGTRSPRAGEPTTAGAASDDAQVELSRLRAEVDRLRAELDEAKGVRRSGREADTGTGGSGAQQESEPQPIASAVLEGRVSKVSKRSIEVIDRETGEPYVLRLNEDSRVRRGQRRIPATRIREGSEVRASFDLISGDTYATQIDVLGKGRR